MAACWFQELEDLHIVASIGTIVSSEGSRPGNLHTQQQSRCQEQSGDGPQQVQPQCYIIGPLSSYELSGPCCFPGDRSLLLPNERGVEVPRELSQVPWEHLAPPFGNCSCAGSSPPGRAALRLPLHGAGGRISHPSRLHHCWPRNRLGSASGRFVS